MGTDDRAEEIRQRMAMLRNELSHDVREAGRTAQVMTDWRFYVRRFPWAVAGLAALAGFMLIPRKKQVNVVTPDPDALAELIKKKQLRVETAGTTKDSQSMMKSLLLMGITWAAKVGMNYMSERVRAAATQPQHNHDDMPTEPSTPPHQAWPR